MKFRRLAGAPPTISADALAVLQTDTWPGNIRELENVARRLMHSADSPYRQVL
jgi:DNA-binding NtrC family response regulator